MTQRLRELVGVEHAAGGVAEQTPSTEEADPETHCGLCGLGADQGAWEAMVHEIGVPFRIERSDDLSPEEMQVVREIGAPCVVAHFDDADVRPVVLAERLEALGGDPTRLAREVRLVSEQQDWLLPHPGDDHTEDPEEI